MSAEIVPVARYLQTFLSRARCLALAQEVELPEHTRGLALFADISGFTPLAEALGQGLDDPRHGAEVLTRLINSVFEALIDPIYRFGGDVLGFAGDAMLCWFPDAPPEAALTCALTLQRAMDAFVAVETPGGSTHALTLKVGLAAGAARRLRAGAPEHGYFELLTGATLLRMAEAEHHAAKGEVVAAPEIVAATRDTATWGDNREGFRPLLALAEGAQAAPVDLVRLPELPLESLAPYFPPDLFTWLSGAQGQLQAELRPVVSAFVRFEGLDYEHDPDAPGKLDAYVRLLQRSAARYGGYLARLDYGDKGHMAHVIFGAPVAHEDDEVRAVAWILDLQDGVRALPFITGQTIGATKGQVYAGALGATLRRGYTLMGDEVNVSARLMQACQRGQALVSQRIVRAAQKHFAFHQFPGFQVKGKFEPIPVGTPVAPLPPLQAVAAEGPLVGREAELAQLQAELEAACAGAGRVVRVEGAAGVGKSRLVGELMQQALSRGVRTLLGSGQSVGQNTSYLAWRDIFRVLFGLQSGWPVQQQALQIEMQLRWLNPDWLLRAPLLGDLLGIAIPDNPTTAAMSAQLRQQALFALIEDLLARMAEQIPLLIVLEDCQWLDEASTALAHALATGLSTARVLLVCLHRPPDPDRPVLHKLDSAPHYLSLSLGELPVDAVHRLATGHLGGELPPDILKMIEERAQGNPFFVKELAETLRETAHLRFEAGRWVLVGGVHGLPDLPDSIQGVILARLDRLDEGAKLTLKVASVAGRRFAVSVIEQIHPEQAGLDVLLAQLETLEQRDITQRETSSPHAVERFKSNAVQEVAYATLLYAQRRALHRAVALWYEAAFADGNGEDLRPYYPLLAHHYRYAEEPTRERTYARLAGVQAAHGYANHEALAFLSRALSLTPDEEPDERYELLLVREQVHDLLGEREAQQADLVELQPLADALDDDVRRAAVALRQANYAEGSGDFPTSVAHVQRAIALAQPVGSVDHAAGGYLRWGRMLWKQGEFDAAQAHLEKTLALAREHGLYQPEVDARLNLGIVAAQQGQPDLARAHWEEALSLCLAHDDHFTAHKPLNNLGLLAWRQSDLPRAREYFTQSLATCRAVGYREGEALLLSNLGLVAMDRGDYIDSVASCEQALHINRRLGNRWAAAHALNNGGMAARMLGRYDQAQGNFEQAVAINRELGNHTEELRCLSNLSLLYHLQGSQVAARDAAQQVVDGARELGEQSLESEALTYQGHALAALGEFEAARAAYRQALGLRAELGESVRAEASRAGLVELALAQGDAGAAIEHSAPILAFLEGTTLDGADEPFRIYWAVVRALQAADDPRARDLLAQAHARLQAQAAALPDEAARHVFLEQIAAHREIGAAYAQQVETAPGPTAEPPEPDVQQQTEQTESLAVELPPMQPTEPPPVDAAPAPVAENPAAPAAAEVPPGAEPPAIASAAVAPRVKAPKRSKRKQRTEPLQVETKVKQKRNRKGELVIKVTIKIKTDS